MRKCRRHNRDAKGLGLGLRGITHLLIVLLVVTSTGLGGGSGSGNRADVGGAEVLGSHGLGLGREVLDLGLAEDDVGGAGRGLEDVGLLDDEQDLMDNVPAAKHAHIKHPATTSERRAHVPETRTTTGKSVGRTQRAAQNVRQTRTFLDFFTVTREIPGTGFMPRRCIALRLFFSLRFCLGRACFQRKQRRQRRRIESMQPQPHTTAKPPGQSHTA